LSLIERSVNSEAYGCGDLSGSDAYPRTTAQEIEQITRIKNAGEALLDTYRKEIVGTIFFFVLYLLMCHTAIWSIFFGTDSDVRILGFPVHYFVGIVLGWFGVLAVSIWWNVWADRLEREIGNSSVELTPSGARGEERP
jgi:hypothetical protein